MMGGIESMMLSDFPVVPGQIGGLVVPSSVKRAVYRQAPQDFCIETLVPTKQGSNYSYGMRICPVKGDTRSTKSGDHREYEIWRRWEDCLVFQDALEIEYATQSRQKRQRLHAGKGVKKDGIYIHDRAASFDSLPPGPDPNSIAMDIHDYLPKLTKKGTFFKASQATVDQRQREFQALIDALFQEDVPTLIKDLRASRVVRDFFGYWRRDKDLEEKIKEGPGKGRSSSVSGTGFSLYFSASNLSLQFPQSMTELAPSSSSSNVSRPSTSPSRVSSKSKRPSSAGGRPSTSGSGSRKGTGLSPLSSVSFHLPNHSSSSAELSSESSGNRSRSHTEPGPSRASAWHIIEEPRVPAVPAVPQDIPISPSHSRNEEELPRLQSLPEDCELESPMSDMTISPTESTTPPIRRRARTMSAHSKTNRNAFIFMDPVAEGTQVPPPPQHNVPLPRPEVGRSTPLGKARAMSTPAEMLVTESDFTVEFLNTDPWELPSSPSISSSLGVSAEYSSAPSSSQDSHYDPRDSCIEIDLPFDTPDDAPLADDYGPQNVRSSLDSIDSIRTEFSADAIIPRSVLPTSPGSTSSLSRSLSLGSRQEKRVSQPVSVLQEEEPWVIGEEQVVDSYFYDALPPMTLVGMPESPLTPAFSTFSDDGPESPGREQISMNLSSPEYFPKPFQNRPPGQFHIPWSSSPRETTFEQNLKETSIAIKAVLKDCIIVFRTPCITSLGQIRKRLAEKFDKQEGIALRESFALAYMATTGSDRGSLASGRTRSSSVSSSGIGEGKAMRYIYSQDEWNTAVASCGGKLTLRVVP
ncbi:hypothetical protein JAAARDRAFT_162080 [Jaapia argillacea MUCL 33604]|uniref:PX domain-containing protein n=1 Tax=Jaapia argillacea MUCL 33604 TaxID=933084 RepID=A0A067PEH6_9AGAM|nr:hypothetical protein JAAARDRAFT_162080 [Jaapia argillacea MUCL 33604]